MTQELTVPRTPPGSHDGDLSWPVLPRAWAQALLATELRTLSREIVSQIRNDIPAYRRSLDGQMTVHTRAAVERALQSFFVMVCERGRCTSQHEELFRNLGQYEAQAGRSLDSLQAAYRIGGIAAWRRVMVVSERMPLQAEVVAQLADSVFRYIDRLSLLSAEGYQRAMLGRSDHVDRLRARLLQMLLDQPATPRVAIAELAAQIGWTLPREVQVIDIRDVQFPPAPLVDLLGHDTLTGVEFPPPIALVPVPLPTGAVESLASSVPGARLAVGCAVPLEQARRSLQWAQQAAALRTAGQLPDLAVTHCDEHLPTLLLASDPLAAEILVRRRLGPLLDLSAQKRWKFGRLLAAWLERGGSQADIADVLGLHRQTVHYQFTRLYELFGDDIREPAARVEMLLALRTVLPEWERDGAVHTSSAA